MSEFQVLGYLHMWPLEKNSALLAMHFASMPRSCSLRWSPDSALCLLRERSSLTYTISYKSTQCDTKDTTEHTRTSAEGQRSKTK